MARHVIPTEVGPLAVRVTGDGPPVVLWHSLFVDERSWSRVEDDLATGRTLVTVTGPGHGTSGDPGRRYSNDGCAVAALQVLDALGIHAPVDWVGNAWGGHIGMLVAARRPERCRTLVTLGTPVQALSAAERTRTLLLLLAYRLVGAVGFVRSGVVDVLLAPRTRATDPAAVALVEDCLTSADRSVLHNAIASVSLDRTDLAGLLPHVEVPTLFVTGTDHKGWTPDQARAAGALLPDGAVAEIADSAYLVPWERPAETVRLVREFWAAHAATGPTPRTAQPESRNAR